MVTANELSSLDITRIQTPQPRGESAAPRNAPQPASGDVLVSISAEGRAAEESARTTAPVQRQDAVTVPDETVSANPVQAASRSDSPQATDNATAAPNTERAPDAASAAGRAAIQLFLENAARPDNQTPAPSSLRTSA